MLTDARLGEGPSPALVNEVTAIELAGQIDAAEDFVLIDLAHVLMLTRTGVFPRAQGAAIVGALLRLRREGAALVLSGDPAIGSITLQIERYLERELGPVGLDIQRARSRIDQNADGMRLINRRGIIAVLRSLVALGEQQLATARRYRGAPIPGYTHLQHAQPTTFDHYLNAHYWVTSRNISRLRDAFDRLNYSSLGGAAYSGTSWPIDRRMTAAYLGFTGPIPNARDAGLSAYDGGAEIASILGLALSGLSKEASDLYFWSSTEVRLLEIPASLSGTSSMMPQKRNPISLERIRALAGEAAGWGASQLGMLHYAASTDSDQAYVQNQTPSHCAQTAGAAELLCEVLAGVELDVDAMRRSAGSNWATASALADELVATAGLSFRVAHDVVARLVSRAESNPDEPVDRVALSNAAQAAGVTLDAAAVDFEAALDVDAFLESRISLGGTSSARRGELEVAAQDDLREVSRQLASREAVIDAATTFLLTDAEELAGHRGS